MSLPYFPMFPKDFEAKTSHLSLLEDGAYNRLLRLCWMTPGCSLPDDEAWIMRRARAHTPEDQDAVRAVLAEFFTVSKGRYSNAKLTEVFDEANEAHEKRVRAGSLGGKAKSLKTSGSPSSNATAKPKQPEPEPEPKKNPHTPKGFDEFWAAYPRKVARGNAAKAYAKAARNVDPAVILAGVKRYAQTAKGLEDRFIAHPATWLNGERWADEAPTAQPGNIVNMGWFGTGTVVR
jgi:uncharacterized protein YdaU (DUF1376 family)